MNLIEILDTIDSYAREYIRYVLSVASRAGFKKHARDFEPRLINFSVISVVIGGYLFDRFVRHSVVGQPQLLDTVGRIFPLWVFISAVMYIGFNFRSRAKINFSNALSIILRVLPVAFVLSTFAATVMAQMAGIFRDPSCSAWWGYSALMAGEPIIVMMYLPTSIMRYVEDDHVADEEPPESHSFGSARRMVLTVLTIVILFSVRVAMVLTDIADNAPKPVAHLADAANALAKRQYFHDAFNGIGGCFR